LGNAVTLTTFMVLLGMEKSSLARVLLERKRQRARESLEALWVTVERRACRNSSRS
jgi:hypothetical protein